MRSCIEIGNKKLDDKSDPFCIAEVGINHNGDLNLAKKMIEIAKASGADAVKFQTFRANEVCSTREQLYSYKSQGVEIVESMLDMLQRCELHAEEWLEIKNYCNQMGITFLSTPQNNSDLNLLQSLGIEAIKVGSDDLTNLKLLKCYASSGLPIILSSGMADLSDVNKALEAVGWFNGYRAAVLLCTSQYPAQPSELNISRISTLKNAFPGLLVGFSDHTEGELAACLALAKGARIFEKHFTLDKGLKGPDHWFSANPAELRRWIEAIKNSYEMLGYPEFIPSSSEYEMRKIARRSLVAVEKILKGDILTEDNLGMRRPGTGLTSEWFDRIIGLRASRDINIGELIDFGDASKHIE